MKICDLCDEKIVVQKDYTNANLPFTAKAKNIDFCITMQVDDLNSFYGDMEKFKYTNKTSDLCDYCKLALISIAINNFFKEKVDERLKKFAERS